MEKKEELKINLMPLSFFKAGGVFTGNINSMRYMVKKEAFDEDERLSVYAWPGPFIFEKTGDELKISESFSLSDEGIKKTAEWLEDIYSKREEEFSQPMSLLNYV